jgi:MFS family permease
MGLSKNVGDFYGAHVLVGFGAAPFEALVAISIADVWFAHERGSKLGTYVFGLAFGSFIGPLCAGFMAVNQGWRWIYWWGAILSGALFILFFFTFEESRFIRTADAIEGQSNGADAERPRTPSSQVTTDEKKVDKQNTTEDPDLSRAISHGPKAGDVFDAVGFTIQLHIVKLYPEPWAEIVSQVWRPLKVFSLPAVVWVSLTSHPIRRVSLTFFTVRTELWNLRQLAVCPRYHYCKHLLGASLRLHLGQTWPYLDQPYDRLTRRSVLLRPFERLVHFVPQQA